MKGPVFLIDVLAFLAIDILGTTLFALIRLYFDLHLYAWLIPSLIWIFLVSPLIFWKLSFVIESKVLEQLQ